jgi:hypothetical protein
MNNKWVFLLVGVILGIYVWPMVRAKTAGAGS